MWIKLTDLVDGGPTLVFFGAGGVVKATRFEESGETELYNESGEMLAKVAEPLDVIAKAVIK